MTDKRKRRFYGRWAGNERGFPEDTTRCIKSIFRDGSFISSQCSRKRGHGPNGLYCKQHGKAQERTNELLKKYKL